MRTWSSASACASSLAAMPKATTNVRSNRSSSGVAARCDSAGSRPRIGLSRCASGLVMRTCSQRAARIASRAMSSRVLGVALLALASLVPAAAAAAAPASPTITYYFGLERPEAAARAAYFAAGDPGSAAYRRFLPVGAASARLRREPGHPERVPAGAAAARVHGARRLLRRVRPRAGSVRRFERVFDVRIRRALRQRRLANAGSWPADGPLHLRASWSRSCATSCRRTAAPPR